MSVDNNKIDLSLRHSRTGNKSKATEVTDAEVTGIEDLKEGQVLRGYVKSLTDIGAFVR